MMPSDLNVLAINSTTARLMSVRLGEIINVRDFGAKGDLIADDTSSIQSAINTANSLASTNGSLRPVYFPPGYYLSGPLNVFPRTPIVGAGSSVSRIYSNNTNQTTFSYSNPSADVTEINFRGIGLDAAGKNGIGISLAGTAAVGSIGPFRIVNFRIEDVEFGLFTTGLKLRLCGNVWLEQLHAANCYTGFHFDTCGDVKANHCYADNGDCWGFYITDDGQNGASGEGVYLTGCTTNVQGGGLFVLNQHWGQAVGCSFTSCSTHAVSLDGAWAWKIGNCELASTTTSGHGIRLSSTSQRCVIVGNYFALNNSGIYALGTHHQISSNIVDASIAGGGPDIDLSCQYTIVHGNKCMSSANP